MKSLLALLCSTVILSGCSTTTTAPQYGDSNAATIYFVRKRAEPLAWNLGIYIDGKKFASLANNSYATFKIPPGQHKFEARWPGLAGMVNLEHQLDFASKKNNYFLISSDISLLGRFGLYTRFEESIGVVPLTDEQAMQVMSGMDNT